MKYKFTRKISPKRFFPEMNFESVDFGVEDCDSPQEAMKEVDEWIAEWIQTTKDKMKANMTSEDKFKEELEDTSKLQPNNK